MRPARSHAVFVIALVGVTFLILAFLGFRASVEWENTATAAAGRRAAEALTMLETVLATDMQGVQKSVLGGVTAEDLDPVRRFDLVGVIADAFARFPYPEVFFVWDGSDEGAALFSRTSRIPEWAQSTEPTRAFPVTVATDRAAAGDLGRRVIADVIPGERFAIAHVAIDGTDYQVVARTYPGGERTAVLGFAVNLAWVREYYFRDVATEIAEIGGGRIPGAIAVTIAAPDGHVAGQTSPSTEPGPTIEGRFPLAFFDPAGMPAGEIARLRLPEYTARVDRSTDPLLEEAGRFARMTRWTIVIAAAIAVIALAGGIAALRKNAELDRMKSEFVARASHELKTPLASMRLTAETLSEGRYSSEEIVRSYGQLLLAETSRLDRLVAQLLTFSRLSEGKKKHHHDEVDVGGAIEEAFRRLRHRLDERGFRAAVTGPDEPLMLRGDREALVQAFENIIENSLKYSEADRNITATIGARNGRIAVEFADRGPGIPAEEVGHVFERFFRGRAAKAAGAGLGLSIVRRIIEDHGGTVELASDPGRGTRVTISLPEGSE